LIEKGYRKRTGDDLAYAIEKIRAERMTASEAGRRFEQMARSHPAARDQPLVDILITRVRHTKEI
jgi:hypothetical protein